MPRRIVQPFNRAHAKAMRRAMTEPEFRLWWRLRPLAGRGLRFRRQVPIGPYIVDFFCPSKKLVVELDGSQHGRRTNAAADASRTAWLEQHGYRVIRFWNGNVLSNVDDVCDAIVATASER